MKKTLDKRLTMMDPIEFAGTFLVDRLDVKQIADCDEGYSVSRTCEISLTLHGKKNYRNILYLVEEATRIQCRYLPWP